MQGASRRSPPSLRHSPHILAPSSGGASRSVRVSRTAAEEVGAGLADQVLQALLQRRDALLAELTQLEAKHRDGTISERAERRRLRIVNDLEHIYAGLDATVGPRGGGEGIAA